MLQYTKIKPRVYVETTVVSYLVARPSRNMIVESRQRATRRLWEEYSDRFEFVISNIVLSEAREGDSIPVQKRLEVLADLTVLDMPIEAVLLVQNLIDAGAVPQHSLPDAEHIAIATVNNVEYLVSWNYKHIVNETKRNLINEICQNAGFEPTILCTPTELMEAIHVKEKPDPRTDPVLEECYRMKEAFAAKFNSARELHDYLVAETRKNKALGWKYLPLPSPEAKEDSNKKET